jgi:hypothetical protein
VVCARVCDYAATAANRCHAPVAHACQLSSHASRRFKCNENRYLAARPVPIFGEIHVPAYSRHLSLFPGAVQRCADASLRRANARFEIAQGQV